MLNTQIPKDIPLGNSRFTLRRVENFCRNYLYANGNMHRAFCEMIIELIEQHKISKKELEKDAYTFFFEKERCLWCSNKYAWDDLNKIPKSNGVYMICNGQQILYIGESKNMWDRLYRHHRIANHSTFRNRLKKLKLDTPEFFEDVYVQLVELPFGRKEFEEYLINRCCPLCNKGAK